MPGAPSSVLAPRTKNALHNFQQNELYNLWPQLWLRPRVQLLAVGPKSKEKDASRGPLVGIGESMIEQIVSDPRQRCLDRGSFAGHSSREASEGNEWPGRACCDNSRNKRTLLGAKGIATRSKNATIFLFILALFFLCPCIILSIFYESISALFSSNETRLDKNRQNAYCPVVYICVLNVWVTLYSDFLVHSFNSMGSTADLTKYLRTKKQLI